MNISRDLGIILNLLTISSIRASNVSSCFRWGCTVFNGCNGFLITLLVFFGDICFTLKSIRSVGSSYDATQRVSVLSLTMNSLLKKSKMCWNYWIEIFLKQKCGHYEIIGLIVVAIMETSLYFDLGFGYCNAQFENRKIPLFNWNQYVC